LTSPLIHRLITFYLAILTRLAELGCRNLVKEYGARFDPFILRKGSSDIMVFWQIFRQEELKLPMPVRAELIIDAGANVGYSTIWFAEHYPDAQIIAIEPEESNYEILVKHCRRYERVHPVRAALYHKEVDLDLKDSGWGAFAFMTEEGAPPGGTSIRSVTIESILREFRQDHIDILKVDIEGSERELFSENYESWLPRVDVLFVETHERMKRGSTKSVYDAVRRYAWTEYSKRDKKLFIRRR
jgi:FkbM family methyltransferase